MTQVLIYTGIGEDRDAEVTQLLEQFGTSSEKVAVIIDGNAIIYSADVQTEQVPLLKQQATEQHLTLLFN